MVPYCSCFCPGWVIVTGISKAPSGQKVQRCNISTRPFTFYCFYSLKGIQSTTKDDSYYPWQEKTSQVRVLCCCCCWWWYGDITSPGLLDCDCPFWEYWHWRVWHWYKSWAIFNWLHVNKNTADSKLTSCVQASVSLSLLCQFFKMQYCPKSRSASSYILLKCQLCKVKSA